MDVVRDAVKMKRSVPVFVPPRRSVDDTDLLERREVDHGIDCVRLMVAEHVAKPSS